MAKLKITLSVEQTLLEIAKKQNMNISEFLEKKLAEQFGFRKEVRWVSDSRDIVTGIEREVVVPSEVALQA